MGAGSDVEPAPGPVETVEGGVGTVALSEPAGDGSEELGIVALISVSPGPGPGGGGDDVTSARASPTAVSASTTAARIRVSLRCRGPVIGLRHQAGDRPGPRRQGPAGASSED